MTHPSRVTTQPSFTNLFRYDQGHSPFVDAFAHFSVHFASAGPMGLHSLSPRGALATYQVLAPALALAIADPHAEGALSMVRAEELTCWPWAAAQRATVGDVQATLEAVYLDATTLVVEWQFHATQPTAIQPQFLGTALQETVNGLLNLYHGTPLGARHLRLEADGTAATLTLSPQQGVCHLPWVGVRVLCADPRWQAHLTQQGQGYAFAPVKAIPVEPDAPVAVRFQIEVRMANLDDPRPAFLTDVESRPLATLRAEREAALRGVVHEVPNPHIARARLALLRNGLEGLNGEFGEEIASLCTSSPDDFSCSFFWDSLFSSTALARFHPRAARDAIATVFCRHFERDGSTPERKSNFNVPERMMQQSPQSPVASWAVSSYLNHHNDPEFLARIYPFLVRNHGFWETYSDVDRDGLAEYRWSGQAADNSPLWDPYKSVHDTFHGCSWLPPVASVALNCFLYRDARHLEALARRLGREADAERFRTRQRALSDALHQVCYVPDERRYWDYNHHTQTHERVRTFYLFWPLAMGLPVEDATAKDLIENVLLDPRQFFGEVPFPSVAYDDPRYDPSGYWRGKAWPHISYWLLQMLWRYGYHREADVAANRMITLFTASPGFLENAVSQVDHRGRAGFSDYNWGSAAALLVLERAYRESDLP